MCTYFDVSSYRVLKQLTKKDPKTDDDLYEELGDEVFQLALGGATLGEFLAALAEEGYLRSSASKAYVLTKKGVEEVKRLERIVGPPHSVRT